MPRPIRLLPLPALVLVVGLVAAPAASAATSCAKAIRGKERKLGATYVTSVKVTGTTCATGLTVVKAFHSCRKKKGVAGRCRSKVKGYTCTEKRPAAEKIPTQYTGHVTCKARAKRVIQVYQQNT